MITICGLNVRKNRLQKCKLWQRLTFIIYLISVLS